jgi:hypothetical protein
MAPFWPEFLNNWQAIVSVAAVVISLLQAFIAMQQWKTVKKQSETAKQQGQIAKQQAETAKSKLRLDLFDRRMVVYDSSIELVRSARRDGYVTPEESKQYAIATKGAEFLFNKEIDDYCMQLQTKASMLTSEKIWMDHVEKTEGVGDPQDNQQTMSSHNDRMEWFGEQLDEIPKRFVEFLKIEG